MNTNYAVIAERNTYIIIILSFIYIFFFLNKYIHTKKNTMSFMNVNCIFVVFFLILLSINNLLRFALLRNKPFSCCKHLFLTFEAYVRSVYV